MLSDDEAKALITRVEALARRVRVMQVLAIGALIVALAGGSAWAASRYLITSTSQIKPSVLKALREQRAPEGARGYQGPTGPAGAAGSAGQQGAPGVPGPQGPGGSAGLPAGFSGTGPADVEFSTEPNVPVTAVAVDLPAGTFIASGNANVLVQGWPSMDDVINCQLVDTPSSGAPLSDTVYWEALGSFSNGLQAPGGAEETLPLNLAVSSTSPSTLAISCSGFGLTGMNNNGPPAFVSGSIVSSTVTAIQTSGNTQTS
ncbi:MAG TPA: hypothetical protein VGG41_07180 [Solirubrobacteraceae bacterium]|jgi:hypothetical protein